MTPRKRERECFVVAGRYCSKIGRKEEVRFF
jgi:hypothetical protein